jgi:hypothetical protein
MYLTVEKSGYFLRKILFRIEDVDFPPKINDLLQGEVRLPDDI